MRNLVESLFAAQAILLQQAAAPSQKQTQLDRLRDHVPAPVLAHYLRLVEQGRKGAAVVRNGVCTGCHLRVASGVAAALARPTDLYLCDNCGAYLLLAPEDMPEAKAARMAPVVAAVRKPRTRRVLAA